ncbi:hypothetical protein Goklo_021282 [Gossypium klotzschianum]|uniref:Uncharacterized protein n=1 Tax=Gossypium klotzschianum TaxID=34286 RepID=A0A7J8UVE4_9ROSI|nr:hypothetical protein [Gossypium klotzschianum]
MGTMFDTGEEVLVERISRAGFLWRWLWKVISNNVEFSFLVLIPSIHLSSGNEKIILYACDCSNETLQRAKEFVAASNVASVENRFWPFYCDFATTGFPKWLACANCRENLGQKDQICVSDVGEERTLETGSWSMEERSCCVGGVDFVTLVCILYFMNSLIGNVNRNLNFLGNEGK